MGRRAKVLTASGLNLIAGIWLLISPYMLGYFDMGRSGGSAAASATAIDLIVGFVIVWAAAIRYIAAYRIGVEVIPTQMNWLSWVNAILGLLLIASPFLLQFTDLTVAFWNNIIVGIVVAVLAGWNAVISRPVVT